MMRRNWILDVAEIEQDNQLYSTRLGLECVLMFVFFKFFHVFMHSFSSSKSIIRTIMYLYCSCARRVKTLTTSIFMGAHCIS